MAPLGRMAQHVCTQERMILTSWETLSPGMVTTPLTPSLASVPSWPAQLTVFWHLADSWVKTSLISGQLISAGNEWHWHDSMKTIWQCLQFRKLTFERICKTSRHGIPLHKFALSENIFDNGTKCPVCIFCVVYCLQQTINVICVQFRKMLVMTTICPLVYRMWVSVRWRPQLFCPDLTLRRQTCSMPDNFRLEFTRTLRSMTATFWLSLTLPFHLRYSYGNQKRGRPMTF